MNYVDLFAGAGGLSEGFKKAGFNPVAHVEMDNAACLTLKTRTAFHHLSETGQESVYHDYLKGKITRDELYACTPQKLLGKVLCERLATGTLDGTFSKIDKLLGKEKVDMIIGGPPCQVYSLVGRSRIGVDKIHEDVRYTLYKEYGEVLKKYRPSVFVFENVQGLLTLENGDMLRKIRAFLQSCGYQTEFEVLDASEYGVMQYRKRIILIGKRTKKRFDFPWPNKMPVTNMKLATALFKDLPHLSPGDEPVLSRYTTRAPNKYLIATGIRNGVDYVSQHITRPHNERDLEIYRIAIEKWLDHRERLKYPDLPESLKTHRNQSSFLDRFKVIDPEGLSHTVVAHLSKDGHYFIYPDRENPRSISVREAARIQSFPDDYFFEGGRGPAFRQIGNAVPPQLAFRIADKIREIM